MKSLTKVFTYNLRPFPAPRPRVTKWGTYNPPEYTEFKDTIKALTKIEQKFEGAIEMEIVFQFKIPKSWSKTKKSSAYWHTQKPDADNLAKSIKDALNGLVYHDDSQICVLEVVKIWGDCDRIVVEIINL